LGGPPAEPPGGGLLRALPVRLARLAAVPMKNDRKFIAALRDLNTGAMAG